MFWIMLQAFKGLKYLKLCLYFEVKEEDWEEERNNFEDKFKSLINQQLKAGLSISI